MKKKRVKIALVCILCGAMSVFGQDVPKGQFEAASVYTKSVEEKNVVYSADAEKMSQTWISGGFYKAGDAFKTGNYKPNVELRSQSAAIQLPAVASGSNIYLKLVGAFEVENYYDRISVEASTDGGSTFSTVYSRSGSSMGEITDYAKITRLAGQSAIFRLQLQSDASEQSSGWSISEFSVVTNAEPIRQAAQSLRSTSGDEVSFCSKNTGMQIEVLGISWESDTSAVLAFSIYDAQGNSIDNSQLDPSDFDLLVNGNQVGCKSLTSSSEKQKVDVVYMIDNSGSMSDEQDNVHISIPDLITGIGNNFDASAALLRFGQSGESCPFSWEGDKGRLLFSIPSSKFSEIWTENAATGSEEEYYAGLIEVANAQLDYRPFSQKVVIMMGDESATNATNANDCLRGVQKRTQAEALAALKDAGFQAFIIQNNSFIHEYEDIVDETGGLFVDVTSSDYTAIMTKIGEKISQRHYMRFCLPVIPACENKGIPVKLKVCNQDIATTTTIDYSGSIERSASTVALDNSGVSRGTAIDITYEVNKPACKEIDSTVVYYSYFTADSVLQDGSIVMAGSGTSYTATIPGENVNPKAVEYSIKVFYSDGMYITSSPISNNISGYTWKIAVKESMSPIISDVVWNEDSKYACTEKQICASITDVDGTIAKATLHYADYVDGKSPYSYNYNDVEMTVGADGRYCAELPDTVGSANGLVYYIYAEDNDSLSGWYGNGNENVHTYLYEKVQLSDQFVNVNVVLERGCSEFMPDDQIVANYEGCNGALVEVGRVTYIEYLNSGFSLSTATMTGIHKNGLEETDKVTFVLYRTDNKGNTTWYELGTMDSYLEGTVSVCPPDMQSESLTVLGEDGLHFENGSVVAIKQAFPFRFDVVNDSENTWYINSIDIDSSHVFVLDGDYKNIEIAPDSTFSFSVTFIGESNTDAILKIYNNTKTDPFVLKLEGIVVSKKECEGVEITKYDNKILVGIPVEQNQSYVDFSAATQDGTVLASYNGYLGHGIQNREVSFANVTDSIVYLTISTDGEECSKSVSLNGQNTENTENACEGFVNSVSVNTWGTMVSVTLESKTTLTMEIFNLNGTKTGVSFGPQLMDAATHVLYLNTATLASGSSYILRVMTDDNVCSQSIIVK